LEDIRKHEKIVATICYIQDKGKTLFLLRNKKENDMHDGKYVGVGGKCEKGEDPYTCIRREVSEEAKVDIKPIYVANLTFNDFTPEKDWEVHLFRAEGYIGHIPEKCEEGEFIWIDNDKINEINLWEGDRIFLEYINSEKFFFGNFEYDNGKLKSHKLFFAD